MVGGRAQFSRRHFCIKENKGIRQLHPWQTVVNIVLAFLMMSHFWDGDCRVKAEMKAVFLWIGAVIYFWKKRNVFHLFLDILHYFKKRVNSIKQLPRVLTFSVLDFFFYIFENHCGRTLQFPQNQYNCGGETKCYTRKSYKERVGWTWLKCLMRGPVSDPAAWKWNTAYVTDNLVFYSAHLNSSKCHSRSTVALVRIGIVQRCHFIKCFNAGEHDTQMSDLHLISFYY